MRASWRLSGHAQYECYVAEGAIRVVNDAGSHSPETLSEHTVSALSSVTHKMPVGRTPELAVKVSFSASPAETTA